MGNYDFDGSDAGCSMLERWSASDFQFSAGDDETESESESADERARKEDSGPGHRLLSAKELRKMFFQTAKKALTEDFAYGIIQMDGNIPKEDLIVRTADNGKKYAMNTATGATSGLGPVDKKTVRFKGKVAKQHLEDAVKSGRISRKINEKLQRRHRDEAQEYRSFEAKGEHKSILTVSNGKLRRLVSQYSGNGDLREANGQFKEYFKHTEVIGIYVSKDGSDVRPTKCGTIHYGKDGCHIVPAKPWGD